MSSETRRHAVEFIEAQIGNDDIVNGIKTEMLVVQHYSLVVVKGDHGFFGAVLIGQVTKMTHEIARAVFHRHTSELAIGIAATVVVAGADACSAFSAWVCACSSGVG
jgi:hypothetical protein